MDSRPPADLSSAEQVDRLARLLHALMGVGVRGRPRDISLTSASVLATLERAGPRRVTELAALEGVAQPSMSVAVDRLEKAALVQRQRDRTDGRAALVTLTGHGAEYLSRRRAAAAGVYARLLAMLPPASLAALAAAAPAIEEMVRMEADSGSSAPSRHTEEQLLEEPDGKP